jgi:hypothetical protein
MPVCIAGMHRSGTSMIASLLHACGLNLGPKHDLLDPAPNNPSGFWESRSFLRLNDAILKTLGGTWDCPPRNLAAGWEDEPRLYPLRKKAEELAKRFDGREPWGWKDPRNCLTLPLWRRLLPDLKVLICVRNPLAVAESLWVRDGISYSAAFDLWLTYMRCLLAAVPSERRLVTHCETYLHDPESELQRVLAWCGLPARAEQRERASHRINPSLVHHRMTVDDLVAAGASAELVRCYRQLCEPMDHVNQPDLARPSRQTLRTAGGSL